MDRLIPWIVSAPKNKSISIVDMTLYSITGIRESPSKYLRVYVSYSRIEAMESVLIAQIPDF